MTIKRLFILSLLGLFIVSCKTNTSLTSNSLIQKRRYTKGFHVNVKNDKKSKADERKQTDIKALDHSIEASINPSNPIENPELKEDHIKPVFVNPSKTAEDITKKSEGTDSAVQLNDNHSDMHYPSGEKSMNSSADFAAMPPVAPAAPASKLLVIIITILLPPLGAALVFGLAAEFWISLLLTLLFYVPGLIYTLIVVLREY